MAPPGSFQRVYRDFAFFDIDPVKNEAVFAERGFDLACVARVFPGYVLERQDKQRYNETCYQAIAEPEGNVFFLIYARRGTFCRLITAWEAGPTERAVWYDFDP